MASYNYVLSISFASGIDPRALHNEIADNPSIHPHIISITVDEDDDDVEISFDAGLSGSEVTALNSLITNYVYVSVFTTDITYSSSIVPYEYKYYNKDYTIVCRIPYDSDRILNSVDIISHMNSKIDEYSIKITNITKDKELGTSTFSNTVSSINSITSLINLPTERNLLELSVKCDGASKSRYVTINTVTFNYE